jgi:hypothetical protein
LSKDSIYFTKLLKQFTNKFTAIIYSKNFYSFSNLIPPSCIWMCIWMAIWMCIWPSCCEVMTHLSLVNSNFKPFWVYLPIDIKIFNNLGTCSMCQTSIFNPKFNLTSTFPMPIASWILSSLRYTTVGLENWLQDMSHSRFGVICSKVPKSQYHTLSDNWPLIRHNVNNCGRFFFYIMWSVIYDLTWCIIDPHNLECHYNKSFLCLKIPFIRIVMQNQHSMAWFGFW